MHRGSDVDAASVCIIGAVGSAVVGAGATFVNEQAKRMRDHSRRWDAQRQSLYADSSPPATSLRWLRRMPTPRQRVRSLLMS